MINFASKVMWDPRTSPLSLCKFAKNDLSKELGVITVWKDSVI